MCPPRLDFLVLVWRAGGCWSLDWIDRTTSNFAIQIRNCSTLSDIRRKYRFINITIFRQLLPLALRTKKTGYMLNGKFKGYVFKIRDEIALVLTLTFPF